MIAKIIGAPKGGGSFTQLVQYITDKKKDGQTLAAERASRALSVRGDGVRVSEDEADFGLPGFIVQFAPELADAFGAFEEDALSPAEAADAIGARRAADPVGADRRATAAGRLLDYVLDEAGLGEKVEWSRVSNCSSDDPQIALAEIIATQAKNTRAKKKDPMHLVVSFPASERPTDQQLYEIEDAICASLGMEEHQRISALHVNTEHIHLHISINKIHPTTFKCVHPSHSQRKLMAACEKLEIKYGLQRTNHGLVDEEARSVGADAPDIGLHNGQQTFAEWVKQEAGPALVAVLDQPDPTWEAVHQVAAQYGLIVRQRGAGLIFADVKDGRRAVKASTVDRRLSYKALLEACGPFQPAQNPLRAEDVVLSALDDQALAQRIADILARPDSILEALNQTAATWTLAAMRAEIRRQVKPLAGDDLKAVVKAVLEKIEQSPNLVTIKAADREAIEAPSGEATRYSFAPFVQIEQRMLNTALHLAARSDHVVPFTATDQAIAAFEARKASQRPGFALTDEQRAAVRYGADGGDLRLIMGHAGTGKSTMLEAAREVWEAQGLTVIGAALSGVATENLQAESGIKSQTVASLLMQLEARDHLAEFLETRVLNDNVRDALLHYVDWADANASLGVALEAREVKADLVAGELSPRSLEWALGWAERRLARASILTDKSVLVVDEAGMVGSRQMSVLLRHAEAAGAKVVLVGDYQQLQSIDAGAPFRVFTEKLGYAALADVRRQQIEWQRTATGELAEGKVEAAVTRYAEAGNITAGVAFDEAPFIDNLEKRLQTTLSEEDRDRAVTIARYAEARNAAGALWSLLEKKGAKDRANYRDLKALFKTWQQKRNNAAATISADLENYKPWLARFGTKGEGLAADMLYAAGVPRQIAAGRAAEEAESLGILDIEETYAPEDQLRPDFRTGAKEALIAAWAAADPQRTRIILAHTRADVADLNAAAREHVKAAGGLQGDEHTVTTENGERSFAVGDRLLFLENNKGLGVRNGSIGTVDSFRTNETGGLAIIVRLDNGNTVALDPAAYQAFDHGYAATIHKSQGVTVDEAYFLGSGFVDAHLAYVAMSRHRWDVYVFVAAGDAATPEIFAQTASIARSQDSSLDYDIPDLVGPHQPAPVPKRYTGAPRQHHPNSKALFEQFQREREQTLQERQSAIASVRQTHGDYRERLGQWYREECERLTTGWTATLVPNRGLALRKLGHDRKEKADHSRAVEKAAIEQIKSTHKLPTWQKWLQERAESGDADALAVLRAGERRRQAAASAILATDTGEEAVAVVLKGQKPIARKDGTMLYRAPDGGLVADDRDMVRVKTESPGAAILALQLAKARYGDRPLQIQGSEQFQSWVAAHAAREDVHVRFADAGMEALRQAIVAMRHAQNQPLDDAKISDKQYKNWTLGMDGRYTFDGQALHEGEPAVMWRQNDTVYVQTLTPDVLAAVRHLRPGDQVEFNTSGRPVPVNTQGLGR